MWCNMLNTFKAITLYLNVVHKLKVHLLGACICPPNSRQCNSEWHENNKKTNVKDNSKLKSQLR